MKVTSVIQMHVVGSPCPICTKPNALFKAVHHQGPPCLKCGTILVVSGKTRNTLMDYCPTCHEVFPMEGKEI